MKNKVQIINSIMFLRTSLNRSVWWRGLLLVTFGLASFALSPQARAACQKGCLENGNTVLGDNALSSNTTGSDNTATGSNALSSNTIGGSNTACGWDALSSNTTGFENTATGSNALASNTTATSNTANGAFALYSNNGASNTASGDHTLYSNTTGSLNTANGDGALIANTTGYSNTAIGVSALQRNISGSFNTATGMNALVKNTGSFNIALGFSAGFNLTTGSNNIDIFDAGVPGESNTIRIGKIGTQQNTYIAGISGVTVASGVGVVIDATGHLGTVVSSERFKDGIKPMDKSSEAILSLNPVTFRYKHDLDPDGIPQFGLVAEQVEKVNPDLVARDEQGKPYTVRYEAVNAMLLNEFLKEHKMVHEQEVTIAKVESNAAKQATTITDLKSVVTQQQNEIQALTDSLKAQAVQIQKVSEQLKTERAPSVVANN